jgi:predicted metal-binding membrane protein
MAWGVVVEIVRLGNEHVGDRARVDGLRANFLVVLGTGIVAVWIASGITALRKRA